MQPESLPEQPQPYVHKKSPGVKAVVLTALGIISVVIAVVAVIHLKSTPKTPQRDASIYYNHGQQR